MTATPTETRDVTDGVHDVVIVGGGPAGCSAGVFCARGSLDTVIFDRGRSSIKRCAYLENYLGFPAGIDVETLYGLVHDHAERTRCAIVSDLVETVERDDDGDRFVVRPQEGEPVETRRVIAATRYDGEYMRGLDDDEAMFETYEYDGEEREHFDDEYAARDGTTPVDGLYVATPSGEDLQAIVAAGRGARVAQRVIADARMDDGWWEAVAEGVDWARRAEEYEERDDRDAWIEWFDERYGEDAPVDLGSHRYQRVRETYVDEQLATYVTDEEIRQRADAGHRVLAEHLDPEAVVAAVEDVQLAEAVDEESLLEAMDEEALLETVDEEVLLEAIDERTIREHLREDERLAERDGR